jgi:hypothetical protein
MAVLNVLSPLTYSMLYSWVAVCFVVGCEISISAETNDDCIHDIAIESTISEGGNSIL